MMGPTDSGFDERLRRRHLLSRVFAGACRACTWSALLILVVLLASIAFQTHHQGEIVARVKNNATPTAAELEEARARIAEHEDIASAEIHVGRGGRKSIRVQSRRVMVPKQVLNEEMNYVPDPSGEMVVRKNRDIRKDLQKLLAGYPFIARPLESSETIGGFHASFLTNYPSVREPESAGVLPGIWGSIWLVTLTGLFAIPVGIGAALYLEEYARNTLTTRLIKINLANLAGVPSVVYGILGFTVFVRGMPSVGLPPLGKTIISGALTLGLLILPIIIVSTQEALKAVPGSIRSASIALGATKWQTTWRQVLPASLPGIATGTILGLSRALGETAPIVLIGALVLTNSTPGEIESPGDLISNPAAVADIPSSEFATLPIQIYNWVGGFEHEYPALAARGILVLLVILICVNGVAIFVRNHYQKKTVW